jgi:hypothetical protein
VSFNPISSPVDYILLANRRSPGIATLSNVNSPRMWDERRGFALSGARVVFRGIGLARPICTLRLVNDADFDAWHEWRELVQRPPIGERGRAQDIWHPILEDLGIVSVVVEDVTQPRQVEDGVWDIDIKFIEFRRPVVTLETIGSSETTPTDPVDRFIDELSSQVQALAGGPGTP